MRDESLTNHIRDQTGNTRKNNFIQISFQEKMIMLFRDENKQFLLSRYYFLFWAPDKWCVSINVYIFEQDLKYRHLIYMTAFIYIFWQYVTFSVSTSISNVPIMSILVIYISISLAKFNSIVEFDFHCVIWLMIRNCLFYEGL